MAIVINKAAVRRSLEQWFIAARAGQTLGAVETAKLSSADAAAQSSDFFFDLLAGDEDAFQYADGLNAPFIALEDFLHANTDLWADMEGSVLEVALQVLRKLTDERAAAATPVESSAPVEDFFG